MSDIVTGEPRLKREIDPTSSIMDQGLIVRRPLQTELEEFLGELARSSGVSMVFDKRTVTELKRSDLLHNELFADISRAKAEAEIRDGVSSLADEKEVGVKEVGLMPFLDGSGALILINFVEKSAADLRKEQTGIHREVRSLVPDMYLRLKRFKKVGMPIGKMGPNNTLEDRNMVYEVGRHLLPKSLLLAPAVYRPRTSQNDVDQPAQQDNL